MRQLLMFAFILLFAGPAVATDLGSSRAPKSDSHILQNPASDMREGGETIETAVPIAALPFYDTGATCDNIHDYNEDCPYGASLSPDLVYSFTADADIFLNIDLWGSLYDTKVFVYENVYTPGLPYACNDDYYSDYTSFIEHMPVYTGNTYFIVIDGYTSDCGDYILNISDFNLPDPCDLVCDGMPEGEPTLGPEYIDNYNSGCGSENGILLQNLPGDADGNLIFCGITGWLEDWTRDTDWFTITVGSSGTVSWTVEGEHETSFLVLGPQDCNAVGVLESATVHRCEPFVFTLSGEPGELIWLWAGPSEFEPPNWFEGYEYNYIMTFTGLQEGPVATDESSWGTVKSMYR